MALTVTLVKQGVIGDLRYTIADIDWDSSYPTAGEALTPEEVGLAVIFGSYDIGCETAATLSVNTRYDRTAEKLQAFGSNANAAVVENAECVSTDDLSALTNRVFFLGQ